MNILKLEVWIILKIYNDWGPDSTSWWHEWNPRTAKMVSWPFTGAGLYCAVPSIVSTYPLQNVRFILTISILIQGQVVHLFLSYTAHALPSLLLLLLQKKKKSNSETSSTFLLHFQTTFIWSNRALDGRRTLHKQQRATEWEGMFLQNSYQCPNSFFACPILCGGCTENTCPRQRRADA